jgi:hypothetical protein
VPEIGGEGVGVIDEHAVGAAGYMILTQLDGVDSWNLADSSLRQKALL